MRRFLLGVLLLIGIGYVVSTGHRPREPGSGTPAPPREPTQEERIRSTWWPGFNQINVVSDCDLAAQQQALSPSTFSTFLIPWTILEHPERLRITVLRGFDAQNVFGATIRSQYRCLVDATTGNIIEVTIAP